MSDIDQALSALDVALASAFNPAGSVSDVFTGLHAHYKVRVFQGRSPGGQEGATTKLIAEKGGWMPHSKPQEFC